jgi:hypothetical protein
LTAADGCAVFGCRRRDHAAFDRDFPDDAVVTVAPWRVPAADASGICRRVRLDEAAGDGDVSGVSAVIGLIALVGAAAADAGAAGDSTQFGQVVAAYRVDGPAVDDDLPAGLAAVPADACAVDAEGSKRPGQRAVACRARDGQFGSLRGSLCPPSRRRT